mmetsp:Transcript_3295/g.4754  ORF Transcript_3295/g.4754 Transcript_3295/m.4754 type:complete len:126 (+) Transcript_3295:1-378(+)
MISCITIMSFMILRYRIMVQGELSPHDNIPEQQQQQQHMATLSSLGMKGFLKTSILFALLCKLQQSWKDQQEVLLNIGQQQQVERKKGGKTLLSSSSSSTSDLVLLGQLSIVYYITIALVTTYIV